MSEKTRLALYYDESCTKLLPIKVIDGSPKWVTDFGRLDAGQTKNGFFYVKNVSEDTIHELKIEYIKDVVPDISSKIIEGEQRDQLKPGESYAVKTQWSATIDANAARILSPLIISGFAEVEELQFI